MMNRQGDQDRPRALRATTSFALRLCFGVDLGFGIRDYFLGSHLGAKFLWASAAILLFAAWILPRRKSHEFSAHLMLCSQWVLLSIVHLWDGQANSMSLWIISLLPLLASVTLGKKETLIYTWMCSLSILFVSLVAVYFPSQQIIHPDTENWMVMRIMILMVFAMSSGIIVYGARLQLETVQEQRRLLKQARGKIDGAIRAKSRFFSGLARELQAPMSEISRTIPELEPLLHNKELQRQISPLLSCSTHLESLLARMLEISQLETQGSQRPAQPFFFQDLLQSLCLEHLPKAKAQNTAIQLRPSDADLRCSGDPVLIRRVIGLLINNAIISPKHDCVELALRQSIHPEQPNRVQVEIEVHDQGAARFAKQLAAGFQDINQFGKIVAGEQRDSGLLFMLAEQITEQLGGNLCVDHDNSANASVILRLELDRPLEDTKTASAEQGPVQNRFSIRAILHRLARWTPLHPCADTLTKNSTQARLGFYRLAHFQYGLLTFCLVYGGIYFARGGTQFGLMSIFAAFTVLLAIRLLDRSCRITVSYWITVIGALLTIINTTMREGGIGSPTLWFIPIGPLMGAYVLNVRTTVLSTLIASAFIFAVPTLTTSLDVPISTVDSTLALTLVRLANIGLFSGMSLLWLNVVDHQIAKLDTKNLELTRANEQARESQQARAVFFTNMSHEIRTPLHGIMGPAQILMNERLDAKTHTALEKILSQANALARMVGCMLDQDQGQQRSVNKVPPRQPAANHPPNTSLKGLRVLIVDDVAVNRAIAAAHLRRFGCICSQAQDGQDAIDQSSENPYGVILMDLRMPNVDGFEATRRIRARVGANQHTPIIAVTAEAYEEQKEQCFRVGMDAHLAKPFTSKDLHDLIAQQLRNRGGDEVTTAA